jgi:Divergent InlB B-repeat domain/Right handed beta helix region
MKRKLNSSARASALQIALAISLLSISSILVASSFANALSSRLAARPPSANLASTSKGSAALSNVVPATTCTVNSTADSGSGTLRDCLAGTADTIDATGVSGTILLTSGELQVTHGVTINGPGAANLAVDGNATFRVFDNFASNVTISGLTITNGLAADGIGGGGILNRGGLALIDSNVVSNVAGNGCCYDGGGMYNLGGATLTVTDSTISGNSASYDGGGIENQGTVTVSNSLISNNSAARDGGGIDGNGGLSITVGNSTISGNSASGGGGGMCACGYGGPTTTITNSTISNNSANVGGGIYNLAQAPSGLTVLNSTISGNFFTGTDQAGGGIMNGGDATVSNSTISGNSGPANGGGGGGIGNASRSLTVTNSSISGNSAHQGGAIYNWTGGTTQIGDAVLNAGASGGTLFDNSGTIASLGYNLASDNGGGFLTGPGDQINTDPLLGPLQDNGGPTFTHALLPGSPAIDHGDPSFAPPPDYDQRGPGYARVVGRIDIGSFEVQPTVTINVRTNPAALTFSVDGTTYSSPKRFTWVAGSSHILATTSPQSGDTGVRYVWKRWSDHGAISHSVTPTTNTIYTATFATQYYLTMVHGTGGRVSPNSGWKNSGAAISISATPGRGYSFTNWTGSGVGSYSGPNNPASITMDGPITESATFIHN